MGQSLRTLVTWLLVLAAAAVALKAIDRVPALLSGTPQGARVYGSVEEAERAVGAKVWLPAFYPETLAWPPARIDAFAAGHSWVAVHIAGRADGRERLVLVQSLDAPAPPPRLLLDPALTLQSSEVEIGERRGTLLRVATDGGQTLNELSWDHGTRRLTLRYDGAVQELLLIARSLERLHP